MSIRSEFTEGSDTGKKKDCETILDDTKKEWTRLWRERLDDKMRAEGIANENYELLFVDRGTVVIATRDYRPLDLREILRQHGLYSTDLLLPPPPSVGGWGRFVRTVIQKQKKPSRRQKWKMCLHEKRVSDRKKQPLRKGGRGWLHFHNR